MVGEWRQSTVGEIAASTRNALVGGPFGSNLVSRDYVDVGVPVIRGQNMGGRWVRGEWAFVTDDKADSLSANLAWPGDLVFTQRGTLGQVSMVPADGYDRYVVSQSQMKLTVDRAVVDPLFIYYVFSDAQQLEYIRQHAIQTGVPHINLGILRDTPLPIPPLSEQRGIAHILGTLDDKIELNRRMNQTLEGMGRALFKSWFVDFDPVRAKMEGRWQSGETLPGLPAELYDLFPDRLVESEVGEVPEGWEVRPLEDLVSLGRDSVKPQDHPDEIFDHFSIPAFDDGCTPKPESGEAIKSRKYRVSANAVLISKLNPRIPRVWLPSIADHRRSICSTEFLVVEPAEPRMRPWMYFSLCSDTFHSRFGALVTGTSGSHQRVRPDAFLALGVVVPPLSVRVQFGSFAGNFLARIDQARKDSETLAKLRDALLPELISGALRIGDGGRIQTMVSA